MHVLFFIKLVSINKLITKSLTGVHAVVIKGILGNNTTILF